ncbi:Protein canopy-like protein 2, partial [Operophtera brumata]
MRVEYVLTVLAMLLAVVSARIDPKNLRCLVCRTTFDELNVAIKQIDKWKKVDSTGKLDIMQLMTKEGGMNPDFSKTKFVTDDDLNKSLEYYLDIMQLMTKEGGMNPDFSKTKFVTDDDLNKSLEYYLDIMQLMTKEGGMNPDFSKTKFVTDDDLNKSLEYY